MASRHLTYLVITISLAWTASLDAQPSNRGGDSRAPGIWHEGRFLGFRPAHEAKTGQQTSQTPPRTAANRQTGASISGRFPVQPAAYQESEEELLLPPAPDVVTVEAPPLTGTTEFFGKGGAVGFGANCWFGRAEYLLWWTRGMDVPALATTGPETDPVPAALGQANTQVLFGNEGLNDDSRSGGRFTLGRWCDSCQLRGIEVTYLGLGRESEMFSASDTDFAVLGRPFFNTETNAEDVEYIALPAALPNGPITGTLTITSTTEFQTMEALYRHAAMRDACTQVDYLLGYRYAELEDLLRIDESTVSGPGTMDVFDQYDSRNTFHGAELGLSWQRQCNPCWSWQGVVKVALGGTRGRTTLAGETNGVAQGGLLVQQPTNQGTFVLNEFGVMTEVGVSLRRHLQCGLVASVGYSFLHWDSVYRAGDQVDTSVNPQQIIPPGNGTGDLRPAFPGRNSDFWAQGLRFGLEYNF